MNVQEYIKENTPANKTKSEIDCLVQPFVKDVSLLFSLGYNGTQVENFIQLNKVDLNIVDILYSWERIEKKLEKEQQNGVAS